MGLLLLYWLVSYPFGIVLQGLLVSYPLGGFLTGVMFVSWLLKVLMVLGSLVMTGLAEICFLILLVVLVVLLRIGFWVASREFDSTEKTPAHLARFGNLEGLQSRSRVWKRLRVSGAHWCSVVDSHVLHECHHSGDGSSLDDRVGVG